MRSLRLGVEVVSACNLMPKDGQGSCSAFVELHFDGQKFRTSTKEKDVNPVWNESFYFNISDPKDLPNLTFEAYVYNYKKTFESKSFLGKVRLTGKSFVPYSNAVELPYPLEKGVIFGCVRKRLCLKVFKTDDPSIESSNEQQHHSTAAAAAQQTVKCGADDMKSEPQAPKLIRTHSGSSSQPADYELKGTGTFLGGGQIDGGRVIYEGKPAASTCDLVEEMQFLFVRVVKARDLPSIDVTGSPNPYVKVRVGKYRRVTKHLEKNRNPEWNDLFAFARDRMQSSVLEVVVKDKDIEKDDFVGIVRFNLNNLPIMVLPDSLLAPKWYQLEDKKGKRKKGELMLAVWNGTQADEAFLEAWHSNAVTPVGSSPAAPTHIHSKVYNSPRLWYLRVNIIEAQDLVIAEETRITNVHVKAQVGKQVLRTETVQGHTLNPLWDEELMFVTAEPFEDHSVLSVEDCVGPNNDEIIAQDLVIAEETLITNVHVKAQVGKQVLRTETVQGHTMNSIWDEEFMFFTAEPFKDHSVLSVEDRVAPNNDEIIAQDLVIAETRITNVHVKAQVGKQVLRTQTVQGHTLNPLWNEELMFVTAEPFEDHLVLSVEDRVAPNNDEIIGVAVIPLNSIEKRSEDQIVNTKWCNLEKSSAAMDVDRIEIDKFSGRLHIRVCLEGGYNVLDESTQYRSNLQPAEKQLWQPSIGNLELSILKADGLCPMKTRYGMGTSDTYCVAKYGHEWFRTRTIINSLSPKYNEQYTWEVYDPATVLTVGVFDNSHVGEMGSASNKHMKVGKVRIRVSTLENDRLYSLSYPLLQLHPSGIKKMGELCLGIRFSCTSTVNMMFIYSQPLLPKMHYIGPLTIMQLDMLRHQAVNIVAARLSRAEPPLRKEVVEFMSDAESHLWSMRRSRANFLRLMSLITGLLEGWEWFQKICMWKNPMLTISVHVLFALLVCYTELILTTLFLYMSVTGILIYRHRPRYPSHLDTRLSNAEFVHPDELDEEFDTFLTSRSIEFVRMRYDRLRTVAGKVQNVADDVVSQVERIPALLSFRDTRASVIYATFCLLAAIVLCVTPFKVLVLVVGFYLMRHPICRDSLPPVPVNFFSRLPSRSDNLL